MTEQKRKLLLFLKVLRDELKTLAESVSTKIMKRSDLNEVLPFKVASNEEQAVIHEMVDGIRINGGQLVTGQEAATNIGNDTVDQALDNTDGNELGNSKRYASSHFRNSDDKAA